ncbi:MULTISPECIES: carbohydrate kinase family protein [unclassified Streptomyces]|uniref:carbohydrate kinase family protein n=1 Tax=unclassified Streptomyces TaxID=2593676 RepID=UPI0018FE852B|nr:MULTISPECIES: carbohydrate kinase family protein [unclassified Streptomyces]
MTFPGRITDQLLADRLDRVSLSFLVDDLEIREGGVAANIAYGLALLGHRPLLVGAVGADFAPYGDRLAAAGVDTAGVRVSETRHTARFLCTTDPEGNQLASFYPGAMAEASAIDLAEVTGAGVDLVLIGADDPAAMLRHTRACRSAGLRFMADPSQQLARLDGPEIRELVDGADHLFTNEYEHELLLRKTGWTRDEVLGRVGTWVTTLGEKGSRIERAGEPPLEVAAAPTVSVADPTGGGDAFRAGYLAALAAGLDAVRCARTGSVTASLALAAVGTQTYEVDPVALPALLAAAYGTTAAGVASREPGSGSRR